MKNRLFVCLLSSAFIAAAPLVAQADPRYLSEGQYYGTTQPTPAPGVPYPVPLDSKGNLKISDGGSTTGCVYTTPPPTLAPGQQASLACDVNNNVNVNVQVLPTPSAPTPIDRSTTVSTSSTVLMAANSSRVAWGMCDPAFPNKMHLYYNIYNAPAVVGANSFDLAPGECTNPDAIPAISSQISVIASPEPGSTAVPVTVPAYEQ